MIKGKAEQKWPVGRWFIEIERFFRGDEWSSLLLEMQAVSYFNSNKLLSNPFYSENVMYEKSMSKIIHPQVHFLLRV